MHRILVVDLEATCWEGEPPPSQKMEIIEIGCAILENAPDKRWEILDNFSILIKPRKSVVSQYCEDLTGITQKALDDGGVDLETALEMLRDVEANSWASWGQWDYDMLVRECKCAGLKHWTYLPPAHLNAKALFSAKYLVGRMGISRAMAHMGLAFQGKPHRGADDALNAAELLRKILNGGC